MFRLFPLNIGDLVTLSQELYDGESKKLVGVIVDIEPGFYYRYVHECPDQDEERFDTSRYWVSWSHEQGVCPEPRAALELL